MVDGNLSRSETSLDTSEDLFSRALRRDWLSEQISVFDCGREYSEHHLTAIVMASFSSS